jgi:hypothetical protein
MACARAVCAAPAPAGDEAACAQAEAAAERAAKTLPPKLLGAIGMVESGRAVSGRYVSWPWTIDVGGAGRFFDTKDQAIQAVQALQASGVKLIDVGCMQIDLAWHPAAFASLEEAFDPRANAAYAARFLAGLFQASGSWPQAIASYHSNAPDQGAEYGRRVAAIWPLAADYGAAPADPAAPAAGVIDPHHVYTPEFARRLASDAADRARREARLRAPAAAAPRAGQTKRAAL